ncbi:hypothetical protein [Dyadobacter aurulentus]|uniref:hypothetical protein n=1 Tax=Dyadobacter sp. UC 10 TaxID=2605428 RepID=UPI0011F1F3AF|nr:hypothetical protein [Dyadobacter sp. UC 10]KAA0990805.1 hypothetical protein FXO21_11915 [Dyadobacter sp. UC 10]
METTPSHIEESTVLSKTNSLNQQLLDQIEEVQSEIRVKESDVVDYQSRINRIKAEIVELSNFHNKLSKMHSLLKEGSTEDIQNKENFIEIENDNGIVVDQKDSGSWYSYQRDKHSILTTRFWERSSFVGWPNFLKWLIESTESFLSVNDVLRLTDELDIDKKRKIESAINNALSTGTKNGKFGGVNFKEAGRRFYGTRDLFVADWPSEEHLESLKKRLELESIEITDVILNKPIQSNPGKLLDFTQKYAQKKMEGVNQ